MRFIHVFSNREWLFVLFFGLILVWQTYRTMSVARKLNSSFKSIFFKFLLRIGYFGCLIIALLGPTFGNQLKQQNETNYLFSFWVDTSNSSEGSEDNTLSKVHSFISPLESQFLSAQAELYIFHQKIELVVPESSNLNYLLLNINKLNKKQPPVISTKDVREFMKEHLKSSLRVNPLKYVVFLFSNKSTISEWDVDEFQELENLGIIPFFIEYSNPKSTLDNVFISSLKSRGFYYVLDENSTISSLYTKIYSHKSADSEDIRYSSVQENKYYYFLYLALFLLLIDFLTRVRVLQWQW